VHRVHLVNALTIDRPTFKRRLKIQLFT